MRMTVLKNNIKTGLPAFFLIVVFCQLNAQQDPQYTQYMYNTMSVNPAYAGQREVLSISGLHRSQWVGLEGAPTNQTFGIHAPLRYEKIGIGLSIVNETIGPAEEMYVSGMFAYNIHLEYDCVISFGIGAGFHVLNTDWSKGIAKDDIGNDPGFGYGENVSLFSPIIGTGVYVHTQNWYAGLSVPNLIATQHYDGFQSSIAKERQHFYLIGGYVFNLSDNLKFKPAALLKVVSGAPWTSDLSANFMINEKLTLGTSWRWGDSVSGLIGFQVSENMYLGYSYDATTNRLKNYSSGSHEVFLRFEFARNTRFLSPRFF